MDNLSVIAPRLLAVNEIRNSNANYNDLLELLSQLTTTPSMTKEEFSHIIQELAKNQFIFILTEKDTPVAMITLLIEQKIIHKGGKVAHIEDVVVDKKHRGKGYASKLIQHAITIAKLYNCYKCILNCTDQVVPVYQKNGFSLKTNGMSIYFDK